jgi:ubiquitin-protein ligase
MSHNSRHARLSIEYEKLMNLEALSEFIRIEPKGMQPGWPPDRYVVTYTCKGIADIDQDSLAPKVSDIHQVEIRLGADYPTKQPELKWLTPIWHPNFNPPRVCTNEEENWYPAKTLVDLVLMIGEMVQYKRYHAQPVEPWPLNRTAANWVVDYAEKGGLIGPDKPLDPRRLVKPPKIRHKDLPPLPDEPAAKKKIKLGHIHTGGAGTGDATGRGNLAAQPRPKSGSGALKLGKIISGHKATNRPVAAECALPAPDLKQSRARSLEVWHLNELQEVVPLDKPTINIGRGASNVTVDLLLKGDQRISRIHALLEQDKNGSCWLTAQGDNPVLVNGRELPPRKSVGVNVGDQIGIFNYLIRLQ